MSQPTRQTRQYFGVFVLSMLCALPSAWADGGRVTPQVELFVRCSISNVTGTFLGSQARYAVSGSCESGTRDVYKPDRSDVVEHVETQDPWTATGTYHSETKATTEQLVLAGSNHGTIHSTMQCDNDPWRLASGGACRSVARQPSPETPRGIYAWFEQHARGLPLSVFFSPTERAALKRQYDLAMAKHQKFDPSGSTDIGAIATPRQSAPTILSPVKGQSYLFWEVLLRVAAPLTGATPRTEFELTWLDDPTTPKWTNASISRDTPVALQGFLVPTNNLKGPGYLGRYQVRARAIGQPVPGPWTAPVVFYMVNELPPKLPTQSQKIPPPQSPMTTPQQASPNSQAAGALSSQAKAAAPACKSGFVWREAQPTDLVCAPPASRTRVKQENATAASRRSPTGGPYGPNTCLGGFVWREAFNGDVVCVTPDSRRMAKEENALSASRTVSSGGSSAASGAVGVLRRGVDEKGGELHNETADNAPQTEKQP